MQNFYCDHINLKNVKKRTVGIFHFKKNILYLCTYATQSCYVFQTLLINVYKQVRRLRQLSFINHHYLKYG